VEVTGPTLASPTLAGVSGEPYDTDRVVTIPNVLSALRLLGVPAFLFLLVSRHEDWWALALLCVSGLTDFLDGYIARRFHQTSRLGQILDPMADRLYTFATLIGLAIRVIIPWWLVVVLVARDAMMLIFIGPGLRRRGFVNLPVHFLGKAATFALLYAFPLVLLGSHHTAWGPVSKVAGWAFVLWGIVLYWWSALIYLRQALEVFRAFPPRGGRRSVQAG
jgi:cardiolipin synthase (CMP-forming)